MHGPLNVKYHSVILITFPLGIKTNLSALNGPRHFKPIPFLPEEHLINIYVFIIDTTKTTFDSCSICLAEAYGVSHIYCIVIYKIQHFFSINF